MRGLLFFLIIFLTKHADYFEEFKYWNKVIPTLPQLDIKERERLFPRNLLEIVSKIRKNNENIKLLDLGSGPASILAWGVEKKLFQITALDPLADIYKVLLKKHNIAYPIRPVKGYGENLLRLFKKESFDIVFSRNALDHSISPKKCLENMYVVLKKGGIMYLRGFLKEGTNQKWQGLHQHDITPENGRLIHYNKFKGRTDLTKGLTMECVLLELEGNNPGDWYTIIFKKI